MVFQNYALFPHLSVRAERRVRAGAAEDAEAGDRATGCGEALEMVRLKPGRLRPADAGAALGRAAAAGGAGPRAGARARHPAAGRAARRDRPQAPQGDAARAEGAEQAARHHLRLRHPRPGRGAHDVRPHRGHGQRAGRAAGDAGGDLREPAHRVRGQVHRRVELLRRTGGPAQRRKLGGPEGGGGSFASARPSRRSATARRSGSRCGRSGWTSGGRTRCRPGRTRSAAPSGT